MGKSLDKKLKEARDAYSPLLEYLKKEIKEVQTGQYHKSYAKFLEKQRDEIIRMQGQQELMTSQAFKHMGKAIKSPMKDAEVVPMPTMSREEMETEILGKLRQKFLNSKVYVLPQTPAGGAPSTPAPAIMNES